MINWCVVWQVVRKAIEFFYYLSGTAVAFGVWYSIKQFLLSKRNSEITVNKERCLITEEQIRLFYSKIIPEYENAKRQLGSCFFIDEKFKYASLSDRNLVESAKNYFTSIKYKEKIIASLEEVLYDLQIISVSFDFGIADSEMAEKYISGKYIEIFESIFPIMISNSNPNLFNACVDLYNKWRVKKLEAENKKNAMNIESLKINSFNKVGILNQII